jgi:hypothetical protein
MKVLITRRGDKADMEVKAIIRWYVSHNGLCDYACKSLHKDHRKDPS